MIVDTHTHLWQSLDQLGPQISAHLRERSADSWDQYDAGPQAHEAAMAPVDAAFVLGFRSAHLGARVPNELISEYVSTRPETLVGFAGIDPMTDDSLEELERLEELNLNGVVLSPAEQGCHPTHTRAMRLYERCQAKGLPVLIHQGMPLARDAMLEYAQPYLFDEVARSFPELKLLLADVGYPWTDQTLVLVGKHRNVYAELSGFVTRPWQLYNLLLQAHQLEVTDRLLLGSNFPHTIPQRAISAMYSLNQFTQGTGLTSVPREKLRAIVERDALQCLGLKRGPDGAVTAAGEARTAAPQQIRSRTEASSHDRLLG